MDVPEDTLPQYSIAPSAAEAMVSSEAWTDAQPQMNLCFS